VSAAFVRDLGGFRGSVKLWKMSEPVAYDYGKTTLFVVTSAVVAPFSGPETYVFPADEAGDVLSWGELEGSFKGDRDHQRAIDGLCESTVTP
jgi:hypothetical protein